jgi:hypothetical protein
MKYIYLLFFLMLLGSVKGQSLTGTKGLLHIPTAELYPDKTFAIGASFLPQPYMSTPRGGKDYDAYTTYVTATFFPWMEVMFRYTHHVGIEVNPITQYFPDRMLTVRLQILKEKKYVPAVLFGLQDMSGALGATSESATQYSATYGVVTKNFEWQQWQLGVSAGYAFDFLDMPTTDFNGLFGGVSISHKSLKNVGLLLEHDSETFNAGVELFLFNRLQLLLGAANFDAPVAGISYRYSL